MIIASQSLVAIVALEHLYFAYLEMIAWTQPRTLRAFGMTAEFAQSTRRLAANQGLYNGFLAAGLVWSLLAPQPMRFAIAVFFLSCVIVAGIFGGFTVSRRIVYLQAAPAFVALALTLAH